VYKGVQGFRPDPGVVTHAQARRDRAMSSIVYCPVPPCSFRVSHSSVRSALGPSLWASNF